MPAPKAHRTLQIKTEGDMPGLKKLIGDAIAHSNTIQIDYYALTSGRHSSGRKVDPYALNGLYLSAFCHERGEVRTFNLSRISKIKVLKAVFTKKTAVQGSSSSENKTKSAALSSPPEESIPGLPQTNKKPGHKKTYLAFTGEDRAALFYLLLYGPIVIAVVGYHFYGFLLRVAYDTGWTGLYTTMGLIYGSLFALKRWYLKKYFPLPPQAARPVRKRTRKPVSRPRPAKKKSSRKRRGRA